MISYIRTKDSKKGRALGEFGGFSDLHLDT